MRSGPPIDWPTLPSSSMPAPAPANASRPRREIVGSAGRVLTRSPDGSGFVCARSSRSGFSHPRSRYARMTVGILTITWIASEETNTIAP